MNESHKAFRPMSIETILDLLRKAEYKVDGLVLRERLGINLNLDKSKTPKNILKNLNVPYYMKDYRILRLITGSGVIEINFAEYDVKTGDVLLIKEGSYFEVISSSDDIKGEVLAFVPERYNSALLMQDRNPVKIHPDQQDWERMSHLLYSAYSFASEEPYRKDIVEPMIIALFNSIILLAEDKEARQPSSSLENLFTRFTELLSANRSGKHPVSYYADLLCVTPQYLSKAVSLTSGKTVTEWISKAVVTEAKLLLRETDRTVSEIGEALNFPTDSFFCRFFRKEAGMTPTEYRKR